MVEKTEKIQVKIEAGRKRNILFRKTLLIVELYCKTGLRH